MKRLFGGIAIFFTGLLVYVYRRQLMTLTGSIYRWADKPALGTSPSPTTPSPITGMPPPPPVGAAPSATGPSELLTFFLIIVIVMIVCTIAYIIYLIITSRNEATEAAPVSRLPRETAPETPPPPHAPPPTPGRFSATRIKHAFANADRWLRSSFTGANYRYHIPWLLMIGPPDAGKTTTLAESGLYMPAGSPFSGTGNVEVAKSPCTWWFFDNGAVIDVAGEVLFSEEGGGVPFFGSGSLWTTLLRQLQRYRPKKPLDGLIVALPCEALTAVQNGPNAGFHPDVHETAAPNGRGFEALFRQAETIRGRLWEMQKILGLRVPIYFVITRCGRLTGFRELCRELPDRFLGQMKGWSSPYHADAAYSPEWGREAVRAVERELLALQFELFAEGVEPERRDALFQLPGEFRSVEKPLQQVLDTVFARSAYHESFLLRGVYFCGDNGEFLKDLFNTKVFMESGLARPLKGAFVARNRRVLALQATAGLLAAVLALGLFFNARTLRGNAAHMTAFVRDVHQDMFKIKQLEATARAEKMRFDVQMQKAGPFYEQSTYRLIRGLADTYTLKYPFLPTSYFSDIHGKVEEAIVKAFDNIIIDGVYILLVNRVKVIHEELTAPETAADLPDEPILTVAETPEFGRLLAFVRERNELEQHIRLYAQLKEQKDIQALGELIEYLYSQEIPGEFYRGDPEYYVTAMRQVDFRPFPSERIAFLSHGVERVFERMFDRIFDDNAALRQLNLLGLALDNFAGQERSARTDRELIDGTISLIDETQALIARPKLQWIYRDTFNPGGGFNEIITGIDTLEYFDKTVVIDIRRIKEEGFERLKARIRDAESVLTGYLVRRDTGRITDRLSENTLALRGDLEMLLKQEFMAMREMPSRGIMIPERVRVTWDINALKSAWGLFEPYRNYLDRDLESFPPTIRDSIRGVARGHLEENLLERLADAVSPAPRRRPMVAGGPGTLDDEAGLAGEVENFREASGYLTELHDYTGRLDLVDAHAVLREVILSQSVRLLRETDRLLESAPVYPLRGDGFTWWNGERPAVLAAFSVEDETGLRSFLDFQRERVRHLAYDYAEPLVSALVSTDLLRYRRENELLDKWRRILTAMEGYDFKRPDNPIIEAENLLRHELNAVTPENYFDRISGAELEKRSGDIFLGRAYDIRRDLYRRCADIALARLEERYAPIRRAFDRELARKFPFVPLLAADGVGPVATPDEIERFFRLFEAEGTALRNLLDRTAAFGPSGERVGLFLDRLARAERFFRAWMIPENGPAPEHVGGAEGPGIHNAAGTPDPAKAADILPAVDIEVEFRTDVAESRGINRIIDWRLEIGGETIHQLSEKRTIRWRFGEPITFSLRWAKDGPEGPVFAGEHGMVDPRRKAVVYTFDTPWSLFTFLNRFAEKAGSAMLYDRDGDYRLAFPVETLSETARTAETVTGRTLAFIRLRLRSPITRTVLTVPRFPVDAPALVTGRSDNTDTGMENGE